MTNKSKRRKQTTRHHHLRTVKSGKITPVRQHPMKYWSRGNVVRNISDIHQGMILFEDNKQFRAKNLLKVKSVDRSRGLFYAQFVNPENTKKIRSSGDEDFAVWDFNLKDGEYAIAKGDGDGDGVPDSVDCDPKDPKKQDTYDLEPRYDRAKSFYKKAKVESNGNDKRLYSYGTLVAEIKDGKAIVYGTYSQTTLRHIKDFLNQEGFNADNSRQILKDYSPSEKQLETKDKESKKDTKSMFKSVGMVAMMGEVLAGDSKAEKNKWKMRMIKAGLPQLDVPADWESLSEAEKEKRLNKVIKELKK